MFFRTSDYFYGIWSFLDIEVSLIIPLVEPRSISIDSLFYRVSFNRLGRLGFFPVRKFSSRVDAGAISWPGDDVAIKLALSLCHPLGSPFSQRKQKGIVIVWQFLQNCSLLFLHSYFS